MGQKPSKVLGIKRWASHILGLPDHATALSFDSAVMTFGVWAENRLSERDKEGRPIWTLDTLLSDVEIQPRGDNRAALEFFQAMLGKVAR